VGAYLAAVHVLQNKHGTNQIRTGKPLSAPGVRAMTRAALVAEDSPPALDCGRIESAKPLDARGRRLSGE
jgi:hypothetical protein